MTTLAYRTDAEVRAAIPQVVAHLHAGGLLAYPTETLYGVGSRAREADVHALAELKGRRRDKPFLLLVSDRAMADAQGLGFNAAAVLARAFLAWPPVAGAPRGRGTSAGPAARSGRRHRRTLDVPSGARSAGRGTG